MLFSHENVLEFYMKHNVYSDIKKQAMLKKLDAFLPLAFSEVSLILAPSMERTCRFGLLAATATKCNNWERDSNCQSKNAIFSK